MVQLQDTLRAEPTYSLEVRGLQIRRGRREILSGLDWDHRPGEVAWIIGSNGAGKSSLLRILAGRGHPELGSVRRLGKGPAEREVLYYHPAMDLPDSMLVGDWQRFYRHLGSGNLPYELGDGFVPEHILPSRRVETLSTGEAKRFALEALLRQDAGFIILDEPFEHLSGDAKEMLALHLAERARERVIIVATNQEIPESAPGQVLEYEGTNVTVRGGREI